MKTKEINELTTAEMLDKEKSYKDELFNLRFPISYWSIGKHRTVEAGS